MSEHPSVTGVDGLQGLVGEHIGYSDWHEVTQEQVNTFAEATGDHQWIHVDPERAKSGPFGGPIAHGYLTLSLGPYFLPKMWTSTASHGRELRLREGALPGAGARSGRRCAAARPSTRSRRSRVVRR